jgi:hypothetical protein
MLEGGICSINEGSGKRISPQRRRGRRENVFSFAVERTAKENQSVCGRICFFVFRPLSEKQK